MTFVSYAQNFEDVLLWRALGQFGPGFYVDVGAAHPDADSVTRAFYDRGWNGINIEPVAELAQRLSAARPRDTTLRVAVGERSGNATFFIVPGTGLSTMEADVGSLASVRGFEVQETTVPVLTLCEVLARHAPAEIHFLKIDAEGSERAVLAGADFGVHRPWVVLVEATRPMSTEQTHSDWEQILLDAGYRFVWFDGLNRFYVAAERYEAIAGHFDTPPNVFDDFLRAADSEWVRRIGEAEKQARLAEERADAALARAETALARVASGDRALTDARRLASAQSRDIARLEGSLHASETRAEGLQRQARESSAWVDAMRGSTSWRLTGPLRAAGRFGAAILGRGDLGRGKPSSEATPSPPEFVAVAGDGASAPTVVPVIRDVVEALPSRVVSGGRLKRTVHQFHSGSAQGDAVTNAMLLTRDLLRRLGYRSEIFVEHRAAELESELRLLDEIPLHADYVLIMRHSMGHNAFDRVAALPATKILLYHNITPPDLLAHSPTMQHYARLGREQLAAWRPHVAAALADSEYNAIELRGLGFEAVKACTLLFDLEQMAANAASRSEPVVRTTGRTFTILFVGRVAEAKAQADLVAAYARFRARFDGPSRLVLVGRLDGADAYLDEIDAVVEANALRPHVTLTGLVPDAELRAWYRQADLYVSLSHHEGFGVPLVEAIVHGIPVLAWASGAVPYTLGDADDLLTDRDPDAVAVRMFELAREPRRRAEVARRQRHFIERFGLHRQIPALLQALGLAGAAPPAEDIAARAALGGNMRFTVAGHANGSYSLAAVNRALALALEAERPGAIRLAPVEGQPTPDLVDVPVECRAEIAALAARPKPVTGPEIVISQHYPVHVPADRGDLALAIVFWEESLLPADTVALLDASFRGVLAPTRFVAKTLVDSGLSVPVRTIGHAPDLSPFSSVAAERSSAAWRHQRTGAFTFLHVSSCFPRKGVDVLLAAYARAFRLGDPVRLVIKGFPNPHNTVEEDVAALRARDADTPEIVVVNRDLDRNGMLDLYREADAMVLPTRGEGFNLPAAEAMAASIPLIVTGHGGHMDFCDADTARLLDYSFAPSRSHLATPHSIWVEPDEADLAAAMREAFAARADPAAAAAIARRCLRARTRIATRLAQSTLVRRIVDAAVGILLAPPAEPARLAWISSWDVRCGVAEYSRRLVGSLPSTAAVAGITVLADERYATVSGMPADPTKVRVRTAWRVGDADSMATLAAAVSAEDPHMVVVQHQPGLIGWGALAGLLAAPALASRAVAVTLHNTRHLLEAEERDSAVQALSRISRVVVHTLDDLDLLKSFGLVDNVTLFPHGVQPPRPSRPVAWFEPDAAPLIGCYGFFLPGKGISALIAAMPALLTHWPGARLRLVNADYGTANSREEIARCRALAAASGVREDAIEWITDFLPDARSLDLLAECDLVALPTEASKEASSAALRTALAASRPVVVTPLPLYAEAGDAVLRFTGTNGETFAADLASLLADSDRRQATQLAAQLWLDTHQWDGIARRYLGMLLGIVASADPVPEGHATGAGTKRDT